MTEPAPALRRTLTLKGVVAFGLAYMAPLIVLGTFGVVAGETHGAVPTAYLLAMVAMIFTAHSYGKMAARHPVAGSAYTYVRRAIDSRAGFLVGWATLLDYFFLPMVIWLIGAAYLKAEFPGVPSWVWILAFIAVTTTLNICGIRTAERANDLLMAFQVLVIGFFAVLSLLHVFHQGGTGAIFSSTPFVNDATTVTGVSAGAAVAAYSFLGFDAVTTLTEEAVDPKRTIPRAILLTALIGGGIFVALAYTTQLVHPGAAFDDPDSAAFEIAKTIAGDLFASFFLAGLVVAQFASGIAAQASASRLLYAMGRDGVLPRRLFGYLHPRLRTPALNIALTGLIGLIALRLSVTTSTSFINFGAFTAFTLVNVSVIATYLRERRAGTRLSPVTYLAFPAVGALVDLWLLSRLDGKALTLGLIWLALGICYLAYLTRLFRVPPPEMDFTEEPAKADTAA
ncbi:APC family permease [Streptomyces purpurogeneiscleroticus]|uniref:APC family permease n=1 Tax=Streptomyces purpurogeneiscleroticus TaxID=68259 RepID=UPI001CC11B22|nr:APC family permease [Streptomyces purpurogeneiscleroticus]MBZ4014313.1 Putrescine importer PuuP [Streptomyces purpurogeneiscleroticus]